MARRRRWQLTDLGHSPTLKGVPLLRGLYAKRAQRTSSHQSITPRSWAQDSPILRRDRPLLDNVVGLQIFGLLKRSKKNVHGLRTVDG